MARIIFGTLAGIVAAYVVIFLVEQLAHAWFGVPPRIDPQTTATGLRPIAEVPLTAQLLVILGWCLGTLIGGAIAAWLAQLRLGPWIVAGLIVAGAAATMTGIAHPGWLIAAGLILPWLCAWAAQGLARRMPGL